VLTFKTETAIGTKRLRPSGIKNTRLTTSSY
jgi:hypothetical protein